jgi:single-strand DNA-binding protein
MQASVNIIIVEGGVVREPELKYTSDGLAYTRFPVANNCFSFKNGEKGEDVSYFDISAWGKLAEICSTYLKKGKKIIVSGKLRQSRWKTQEGQNRSAVQIVAQDIKFLPSKKKYSAANA